MKRRLKQMKKVLVAYFSVGGTTKGVAEKLADVTGADIFEIKPKKMYTDDDVDYNNPKCRSSMEMADITCRPEILFKNNSMDSYDVIFVGYPIWWYREPSIIDTFMEQYDFTGKTIVPFCTSGGSDLGKAAQNMQKLAEGASVNSGRRFTAATESAELKTWAEAYL